MQFKGKAHVFGDHVDTDVIIPARFLNISDPEHLRKHCFSDSNPGFADQVQPGDILVAGVNFGCGSSREHAPLAIKETGISCIVAHSFARIFYRNAFNIGLPLLESPEASTSVRQEDRLVVDMGKGEITNQTTGAVYRTTQIPPFMLELIREGGLVGYIRKRQQRDAEAAPS